MDNDKFKLGLGGTAILALGIAVGSIASGGDAPTSPTDSDKSQMAVAVADDPQCSVDPAKYNDIIVPLRAKDPQRVDLLSLCTPPGGTTKTGVNLPLGARWTDDDAWWVGPPFVVLSSQCTDKPDENVTWCEATLQNTNPTAERAVLVPRWVQTAPEGPSE